jgi:hypothetical protein
MKCRDYFDRIFIINLLERTDRRAHMERELKRAGLDPEVGRVEFFTACKPAEAAGFANRGVHGCFRSHLEVLQRCRDTGARNVLILEDDATLKDRFREDEEALIEQLQAAAWGLAYLGHALEESAAGGLRPLPAERTVLMRPYTGPILMTHAYAVNGPILDRLIPFLETMLERPPGHPEGGPMSPDGALSSFRELNPDVLTLVTSPSLSFQRSSRSDLTPKWFDQVPILSQAVDLLRIVKRQLERK